MNIRKKREHRRKHKNMVVQHNLTAMNANRMLGVTTSAQANQSNQGVLSLLQ